MSEEELNKDRLALALEAAGLDLWENDLVTDEVTDEVTRKASKTFTELGYSEEESLVCIDDQFAFVHPEDVPLAILPERSANQPRQFGQENVGFRRRP